MKKPFLPRIFALFVALSLALPNSAQALRAQSGLESSSRPALEERILSGSDSSAGLEANDGGNGAESSIASDDSALADIVETIERLCEQLRERGVRSSPAGALNGSLPYLEWLTLQNPGNETGSTWLSPSWEGLQEKIESEVQEEGFLEEGEGNAFSRNYEVTVEVDGKGNSMTATVSVHPEGARFPVSRGSPRKPRAGLEAKTSVKRFGEFRIYGEYEQRGPDGQFGVSPQGRTRRINHLRIAPPLWEGTIYSDLLVEVFDKPPKPTTSGLEDLISSWKIGDVSSRAFAEDVQGELLGRQL